MRWFSIRERRERKSTKRARPWIGGSGTAHPLYSGPMQAKVCNWFRYFLGEF